MKTTTQKNKLVFGGAFMVLLVSMMLASCKNKNKDTQPSYPAENQLDAYNAQAGFTKVTTYKNSGDYEFGLVFSPNVKGVMNAVTVKIPDVNPTLKVTIWDYDTKAILRTELVNVSSSDVQITKEIYEIPLEKDKKYMITMFSNDWYKRSKPDNSSAAYPISVGNIKFWEYRWSSTAGQGFPANVDPTYNGGDISFNFKRTE